MVDLVIGIALLTVVMLGAFLSLKSLAQGRGAISMSNKVSSNLRNAAEMVRYDAGTRFDSAWDQLPGNSETLVDSPDIRIVATYSTISPVTRSRTVTLVATWRDPSDPANTSPHTKTMTFEVTRVQNKMLGAVVTGRIVKVGTSQGLAGVEVQAQSMDSGAWMPPLPVTTKADGYFTIAGVYVGAAPGARLKVDGSKILAYHPSATKANRKFLRSDLTVGSETKVGVTNTNLVTSPIQMVSVGNVVGYVKDALAGNAGIGDVNVKLITKVCSMDTSQYQPSDVDTATKTVSNGYFEFKRVVPGDYFIAIYGNDQYAAPVRPDDYFLQLGNPDFFTVDPDEVEDRGSSFTTRRGSLAGSVYRVDWNGTVLQSDSPTYKETSVTVKFDLCRSVATGFHNALNLNPGFNFLNTNAWQLYWLNKLPSETPLTTVSGDFTIANFLPIMLNKDLGTYSANNQFGLVRMEPNEDWMASPFSQVRVIPNSASPTWPLATNQVKFLIVDKGNSKIGSPAGTSIDSFTTTRVFANDTSPAPNKVHFLNRNAFGTISGDIRYASSGNPYVLDCGGAGTVKTRWGWVDSGSGYMMGGTGGLTYSGSLVRMDKAMAVNSTFGGTHTYSFPANSIPPNLNGDRTVVDFSKTTTNPVTKTFIGNVSGVRKVLNGASIQFQTMQATDVDATVYMRAYYPCSWTTRWDDSAFVIEDGHFGVGGGGYSHSVNQTVSYSGASQPVNVRFATAETSTIYVTSTAASYEQMQLRALLGSADAWALNWGAGGCLSPGPLFSYDSLSGTYKMDTSASGNGDMSLFRRINTTVNGSAVDSTDGSPITFTNIRMEDRDGNAWVVQTDAAGHFTFPSRYITPYSSWNVRVRFDGNANYNAGDFVYREVYEVTNSPYITIDLPAFSMTKKPTGGGNTGGGGQGGSG